MNVSASTVRKSSRAVSLGFAAMVVAYAIGTADLSGGLWAGAGNCVATLFSLLPLWATVVYGSIALVTLMSSAGAGRLKWGVLPAEAMMLLVAWPFILGKVTLLRTSPDRD